MKHGLLLINLGTPNAPDKTSVRRYLREFLSDPRVIQLPAVLRYLLLYGVILPFRPKQTAHAYQQIWTASGSPLLLHSRNLALKLSASLGVNYKVALGMRYGTPSIVEALSQLEDCEQLTVLPLYPQFSSAATGSSLELVMALLAKKALQPHVRIIRDFYHHAGFIQAQAALMQPYLATNEFILFSFHGVPEFHLKASGCAPICELPCTSSNTSCYRAQCYATANALAKVLHLPTHNYSVAFQSRLGKTPWIKPYADEVLLTLAAQGIKRLAVVCPSFVADCLETLEEVGIRAKAQWLALGGEQLDLIPCVNDSDAWVAGIRAICKLSEREV